MFQFARQHAHGHVDPALPGRRVAHQLHTAGTSNAGPASGRVFLIAGHTDSVGAEGYNYKLGQKRAERVAGYLVGKDGIDPTQVRVVSYGASKPVADNSTSTGRRSNRRVEILVYREKIQAGS